MEEEFSDYEKAIMDGMIDDLENIGAFEWVGMDETGDRVLAPNMELLKEVAPELYNMIAGDITESLHSLYEQGLVEIEYDEELIPTFKISEAGREVMKQQGFEIGET
jgi:hypothetical protein